MTHHNLYRFPFARYPAVRLALLFITGILLDSWFQIELRIWFILFAGFAGCYLYLEHRNKKSLNTVIYRACIGCYLLVVILFGACWHAIHTQHLQLRPTIGQIFAWETLDFYGQLEQVRRSTTGNIQLDVAVDSTIFSDTLSWQHSYTMRATLAPDKSLPTNPLTPGADLAFRATVYPLEGKRNPHEFDYERYLASLNIHTQAGIDTLYVVNPNRDIWNWNTFRQYVLERIDHNFGMETTAPLAKALLIGYKNELNRDAKTAFSRAGLSHIMAVSGLHVGFILAPFWFIVPFFWTLRWGRQTGLILLAILLFVYVGLTGFSASVVRASLTGGLLMFGRLFHKVRDPKNLTATAALVILLADPGELFEVGFQLSFCAVYIILLTMPVLNRRIPGWLRHRWYGKLLLVVLVSLIVQAGLYPLLAYYFGEFSLAGPLINALVIPPLTVLVPYSLVLLPLSAFFPALSQWLNTPGTYFLQLLEQAVHTASSMEGSWVTTTVDSYLIFFIWAGALFTLAAFDIPTLRWKLLCALLTLLCIQQGSMLYSKLRPPRMQVTVFDVGQGDATLVRSPLGRHFLIDTGPWSPGHNSARHVILPHLKAEGIQKLDAVFLSHPHADHIGGISELIDALPIDTIYNSGYLYDSRLYRTYLQKAADKSIPVKALSAGDIVTVDPSMRIFVYGPQQGYRSPDPNEHSLIMELVYGKTEFLFTGDAGKQQEMRLIESFGPLTNTDFLKVGHHGSRTSSSSSFLNTITARQAVVSLSKTNRYGHPHTEAMQRLRQSKTQLCFTSLDGACKYYSDGRIIIRDKWQ